MSTKEYSSRTGKPISRRAILKRKKLAMEKDTRAPSSSNDLQEGYCRHDSSVKEAIEKCPKAPGLKTDMEMRGKILEAALFDIKKLFNSPKCPTGQDYTRHLQVQCFMNLELKRLVAFSSANTREKLAIQIANSFNGGVKLASYILQRERSWVRRRYIQSGLQGKTASVQSMLEDEGTLLAAREYIAHAGQQITAQNLADSVVQYWKNSLSWIDTADSEDILQIRETILALQNIELDETKWSLSNRSAVTWLHRLGHDWKEVRKGLYKDGHERENVVDHRQQTFLPQLEGLKPRLVE
ncbi:hypothetical protein P167DRAFT_580548 [Morchella conica CCBAS932]|uniref:Uncharacterized protein n=1 Tax=Morchella conica CCBAS932 TaxID=1392247 RepID=A0A3N4K7B8_9PEZI|nr:hypothetical protein P167DRAFT_580548 [Morchella conica CCBAS932]